MHGCHRCRACASHLSPSSSPPSLDPTFQKFENGAVCSVYRRVELTLHFQSSHRPVRLRELQLDRHQKSSYSPQGLEWDEGPTFGGCRGAFSCRGVEMGTERMGGGGGEDGEDRELQSSEPVLKLMKVRRG
eukprot:752661-Hanusia_phi.AAC.7